MLDVDRVWFDEAGSARVTEANLRRLARSAEKWRDRHGLRIDAARILELAGDRGRVRHNLRYLRDPGRILRKLRWVRIHKGPSRDLTVDSWNGRLTVNSRDWFIGKALFVDRAYEPETIAQRDGGARSGGLAAARREGRRAWTSAPTSG